MVFQRFARTYDSQNLICFKNNRVSCCCSTLSFEFWRNVQISGVSCGVNIRFVQPTNNCREINVSNYLSVFKGSKAKLSILKHRKDLKSHLIEGKNLVLLLWRDFLTVASRV